MKHQQYHFYVAGAVFIVGLAMLIAGSVMLGIGVHKSKQKTTCPTVTAEPAVKVTTSSPQIDSLLICLQLSAKLFLRRRGSKNDTEWNSP